MPIQINEVVIRTTVEENNNSNGIAERQAMPAASAQPEEQTILEIIEEFLQDKQER